MTKQSSSTRNSFIRYWLAPSGCAALLSAAQIGWADSATGPAPRAPKAQAVAPAPNDHEKTLYEMGVMLSRGLDTLQLSEAEFEAMKAGLSDGFHRRASSDEANAYMPKVQALQGVRGTWFCGAHLRHGFHEDGLASAVHVARLMGSAIPWESGEMRPQSPAPWARPHQAMPGLVPIPAE